jgi:hypothetical protein
MAKGIRTAVWIVIGVTLAIRPVGAACGRPPTLKSLLTAQDIAGIFRGTVIVLRSVQYPLPDNRRQGAGQVAAVRVAQVWKGSIPQETVVYFRLDGNRGLTEQADYLFLAHELSDFGRKQFGLPPDEERGLGVNGLDCGAIPFASPSAARILEGVPGQSPR